MRSATSFVPRAHRPRLTPLPAARLTALPAALLAALVALLALAPAAFAHDALVSTDPAQGAVLDAVPAQATLTFTGDIQDLGTQVELDGPDGAVPTDPVGVDGRDVVLPLPGELAAGDYRLVYRVTSSDGHPVSGEVAFTVSAAAVAAPTPTTPTTAPTATTAPTSTEDPSAAATSPVPASSAPSVTSTPVAGAVAGQESDGGSSGSSTLVAVVLAVVVLAGVGVVALRRGRRQG